MVAGHLFRKLLKFPANDGEGLAWAWAQWVVGVGHKHGDSVGDVENE